MSDPVIRTYRSNAREDMHERLRRLLYEAFFGVDFDTAGRRTSPNERPRLTLVSPSRTGGQRTHGRLGGASVNGNGAPAHGEPSVVDDEQPARPAGVWSPPELRRLP
jgi:hypothetical protein